MDAFPFKILKSFLLLIIFGTIIVYLIMSYCICKINL